MPRTKTEPLDRETFDAKSSYSVGQVAHLVGWTPRWLRQLIREGRVEAFRPGGHQWRIPGSEVKRILESLDHRGSIGAKPSPLDDDQVQVIDIPAEKMPQVDPKWQPGNDGPAPEEAPQKKGFWDSVDEDVRKGNPLLFEGEGG